MNATPASPFSTGTQLVDGPVGAMEVVFDAPARTPRGVAIVAHPQPLLGGSATHKIPQLLARALRDDGWLVARPNFRGVGASQGCPSRSSSCPAPTTFSQGGCPSSARW
jgi:alpha/beta superfamily hydrolase